MRGYLATLLVGYLIVAAFFAGCYVVAYGEDNRGAFVDQATHKTPSYQEERIGDFVFLSATSMIGAGPSPIQPASPVTKTIFGIQLLADFAWTGGVLLTAVGRAMDAKRKQPTFVVTTAAAPSTTMFVHVHVLVPTRSADACVPPRSSRPRRARRDVLFLAAVVASLLWNLRR